MTLQVASRELTMARIYDDEYVADPYPLYRQIREISPVYWDQHMGEDGAWMVTGYDAALVALRDPRLSAKRPQWDAANAPEDQRPAADAPLNALATQVFVSDPPEHSRLRKLMAKPFLPRAVEAMREQIVQVGNELLDRVLDRGEMDFMGEFAMALPSAMVCQVIGIPPEDRPKVWKRILSWGVLVDGGPLAHDNPQFHLASLAKYMDYFREQIQARRDNPSDDLLGQLTVSFDEGGFDSEEELLGNLIFLLTAGQTTTAHQIGNTALSLLANPEVFERIAAEPSLVPYATPEFMRYDSSVQLTKRRASEPVALAGQQIETGQEIFVWMGAAHRDPDRFPDPDRLDPDRERIQNLSLGHGIHYCLGGQLGQLVNEVAITLFAQRVPNPRADLAGVHRTATPTFRGPHVLPLTFG
ncbi:cytochrome P450 [Solihabitans fulvus]|nr:cytochrome P450 [Solihabitans fulvus]